MMVSNRSSVFGLLAWQWRNSLLFVATGALAQAIYLIPRWTHLSLPPTPISVVGGAIGIFVSFRSNHGYARWWEGRQLWGRLINNARDLGSFAVATLPPSLAREVVHRQIAFAHALRCVLRDAATGRLHGASETATTAGSRASAASYPSAAPPPQPFKSRRMPAPP